MEDAIIFKLLRREMHERDIKPDHILTYEPGKSYNIYAASAVVRPEHRNYLRELLKSIFNYWCKQHSTIKLSKVYAYADSTEGWYLIKHLYFSPRRDIGERAFELDLNEPNPSKLITSFQDCLKSGGSF